MDVSHSSARGEFVERLIWLSSTFLTTAQPLTRFALGIRFCLQSGGTQNVDELANAVRRALESFLGPMKSKPELARDEVWIN